LFTSWSPGGQVGATIGKTIYTYVYIEKIFSSRSSRSISLKLSINHSWVKGILNCSNKGPGPLQRGDNYKISKMVWGNLKISFSITTEPE
jgi:hypothetical protein